MVSEKDFRIDAVRNSVSGSKPLERKISNEVERDSYDNVILYWLIYMLLLMPVPDRSWPQRPGQNRGYRYLGYSHSGILRHPWAGRRKGFLSQCRSRLGAAELYWHHSIGKVFGGQKFR